MNLLFLLMSIFNLFLPLKAEAISEETLLQELYLQSSTAYGLATANLKSFKDAQLNDVTKRIQEDQKVILETIRDTALLKDFEVPEKSAIASPKRMDTKKYLQRQIDLHQQILKLVQASSSPILKKHEKENPGVTHVCQNIQR